MGVFLRMVFISLIVLSISGSSVLAENEVYISADAISGKAPLQVTFNVNSSEEIISVSWDLDGDGNPDSTELAPSYTYAISGSYTVQADVTSASGTKQATLDISAEDPFTVSAIAAPSSGIAPLEVHFTTTVSGQGQYAYTWDFTGDGVIDSTDKNPTYTYEENGGTQAILTVTDEQQNTVTKNLPVMVSSYDSKINVVSYFPASVQLNENQITFLVSNEGTETIKDVSVKIIGNGVQHISSTAISRLKAGEQDSLTERINVMQKGNITAVVKIDGKTFPVSFKVAGSDLNKEDLEVTFNALKQKLQELEGIYYEKKADNFMLDGISDSIKEVKGQLQKAQQQMLTDQLGDAKVNLDLASPTIDDITLSLSEAEETKQKILPWLKDNAIALTTIVAAVGTLGGVAVKVSH
ncbi:MAG: PKD domain-containing protein, partial [Nanoarchaeota archaeon]